MGADPLVAVERVVKEHHQGTDVVRILDEVSLKVEPRSTLAIVGPSGAGKSTLLHMMGGLDRPTHGRVVLEGRDFATLSTDELAAVRRRRVGFVFQLFNLVTTLSTWHNIAMPLLFDGTRPGDARERVHELAVRLGMQDKLDTTAGLLSGGEMQRVAVGRAVVARPALVLADEPTGSLDSRTGGEVLDLLTEMVTQEGATLVIVTHDEGVAARAAHRVRLVDGRVHASAPTAG